MRAWLALGVLAPILAACGSAAPASRLDVTMVTDEADAVLGLLARTAAGESPDAEDWRRLFSSEGYVRLQARERSLGREFTDSAFRAFVLDPGLAAHRARLRETLRAWKEIDLTAAAQRAFAYLPAGTPVRAKVYPVIKPAKNSFVFDTRGDPAIFLYLDPGVDPAKLENIIAHELHHIGTAGACATNDDDAAPVAVRDALDWMGGFAEGWAVLAAAGGPDVHPHATSDAAERAVWDRDIARAAEDLRRLETFFLDLLDGAIESEEEKTRRGFSFIVADDVPQGPFYTVGWLMTAVVEREFGRERLVASLCDPRALLADYDRAARRRSAESLPLWSDALLRRIGAT